MWQSKCHVVTLDRSWQSETRVSKRKRDVSRLNMRWFFLVFAEASWDVKRKKKSKDLKFPKELQWPQQNWAACRRKWRKILFVFEPLLNLNSSSCQTQLYRVVQCLIQFLFCLPSAQTFKQEMIIMWSYWEHTHAFNATLIVCYIKMAWGLFFCISPFNIMDLYSRRATH